MLESVLEKYDLQPKEWTIRSFGSGLINHTWLLKKGDEEYILQQVNHNVFKDPYLISSNVRLVSDYLQQHFPEYYFVTPVATIDKQDILKTPDGYFRMVPFVKNSVTYDTVESPELAFEAAKQFGTFAHHLAGFDVMQLGETIPDFHNLSLRFQQFKQALANANNKRLLQSSEVIKQLEKYSYIVDQFERLKRNPHFKKRVMHHDTKISNVLFDRQHKGLCVIDLDTVMPGFFISDVGDMMRTYLAAASEEETNFSTIEVREEYFVAIVQGYLEKMNTALTREELNGFIYSGKFMIFMQCIRFLGDYLLNDVYYGSKYEGQNFNRAVNQLHLLKSLEEKEETLNAKIKHHPPFF